MNYKIVLAAFVCLLLSCGKSEPVAPSNNNGGNNNGGGNQPKDTFAVYHILKGKNYAEENDYSICSLKVLKFKAIFDSSCIYSNADPENQADINKLYGFSDSMTLHHVNSARFGWNWMNGQIHIHAYCYVSTVRMNKELGTVPLNRESDYNIDILPGKYIFTLNGKKDTMLRSSMDTIAAGYKLVPYFGGDEPAPHDMQIKVKVTEMR